MPNTLGVAFVHPDQLDRWDREEEALARADLCAGCGHCLPLAYCVDPDEAYCADCSRYPRLYASTIAIVNAALKAASRFAQSRSLGAAHSRTEDTSAHERIEGERARAVAPVDIICATVAPSGTGGA